MPQASAQPSRQLWYVDPGPEGGPAAPPALLGPGQFSSPAGLHPPQDAPIPVSRSPFSQASWLPPARPGLAKLPGTEWSWDAFTWLTASRLPLSLQGRTLRRNGGAALMPILTLRSAKGCPESVGKPGQHTGSGIHYGGGEVVLGALEHGHWPKCTKVAQTNASSSGGSGTS